MAELRPLTGARGLFAWAVVLYHFRLACTPWLAAPVLAVLDKGYLAVDVFFLLSGFVIWLNYGSALLAGGGARDFLYRRLARIWPLHAAMLVFCAAMATMLAMSGRPAPNYPWAMLPLHLALTQDWGLTNPLQWNDPAWSISAEWGTYLLLPFVAPLLSRRVWSTPLLVAAALSPLLLLWLVLRAGGETMLGADIGRFGGVRCLCEFTCGGVLSVLWLRWRGHAHAVTALLVAALALSVLRATGADEGLVVPALLAACLLALALGSETPRHPLSAGWIHRLGETSYATYLVHMPLFFAFKLAFVRDAENMPPLQAACLLALVLAASFVLHDRLERPAQRWLYARRRNRAAAGPIATPPAAKSVRLPRST